MLSRASSDAAVRLRRAKSNSSNHARQRLHPSEPSDPEATRKHAITAATRAYEKANGLPVGTIDHRGARITGPADGRGQRSRDTRHLDGRRSLPHLPTGHVPTLAERTRLEGQAGYGHVGPATAMQRQQPSNRTLPLLNSGQGNGSDVGSKGSPTFPVRAVRHTRSCYSDQSAALRNIDQSTEEASKVRHHLRAGAAPKDENQAHGCNRALAIPLPLDGQFPEHSMRPSKTSDHDLALARDKHLQTFQHGVSRTRSAFPSTPAVPAHAGSSHVAHHWANATSAGSCFDGTGTGSTDLGQRGKFFSTSIRKSIKKLFRRTSAQDELPAQQVEAGRLHFQLGPDTGGETFRIPVPPAVEALTNSRTRKLRNTHSTSSIRSRSSSGRSVRRRSPSPHDSSRVTSWNNSTAANTITTQGTKRLSVIKEDVGPHRSTRAPDAHTQPQLEGDTRRKPRHVGSRHSIYSALMRRIDESSVDSNGDPAMVGKEDGHIVPVGLAKKSSHSRFDSLASNASRFTKSTIRRVTSRDTFRNFSGSSRASSTATTTEAVPNIPPHTSETVSAAVCPAVTSNHYAAGLKAEAGYNTPSRDQLASRTQRSENRWKAPLDDVRSGSFPSSSRRIMYTDNPYELAPRHVSTEPTSSPGNSKEAGAHKGNQTPTATGSDPTAHNASRLMSPSIYSRDTSGNSPLKTSSTVSLSGSQVGVTGTAIVTPTQPISRYPIGSKSTMPAASQHVPMQSKDWRAWTAEKVAELEAESAVKRIVAPEEYHPQLRRTGHRREKAQINGDAAEIVVAAPPRDGELVTPPLRRKRTRPRLAEQGSRKANAKMNERFPYLDTGRNTSAEKKKPKLKVTPPRTGNEDSGREVAGSSGEKVVIPKRDEQSRQTSQIPRPNLKRPQSTSQLPSTVGNSYETTPPTAFEFSSPVARMTKTPPSVPKRPAPRSKENTPPTRLRLQSSQPTLSSRPARGSASAANLHGRYQAGHVTRKPFATATAMQDDADGMMRRISAGPWMEEGLDADKGLVEEAKWSRKGEGNKENVTPAIGVWSPQYGSARRAVDVFEQVRKERVGGWETEREGWERVGKDGRLGASGLGRFGSLSPAFI